MSEKEIRPIYESLVEKKVDFSDLPGLWQNLDLRTFSEEKTLYDFQERSLKNSLKLLYYFESIRRDSSSYEEAKKEFTERLDNFYAVSDNKEFRIRKKDLGSSFELFRERYDITERSRYGYDYEEIDFYNFSNRMGQWMATGSGKTLVAVKMVEKLHELMENEEIPERDILILTHRQDIIEQFEEEIDDYNSYHEKKIRTWDLQEYSDVKKGGKILPNEGIDVFIYRSDLITEETKEKELSFEDIENNGEWYLLLDEAHKGSSSQSKRQAYFSMLTRNGFLFNFSATFTDSIDILTTAFNFNIDRFSEAGYGKNVLLSDESLENFTEDDFNEREKRKIVLKSLIALTSQKKAREEVNYSYHNPLLTCLVNSVNTSDADLEVFFRELEKIAKEERSELFEEAKSDVKSIVESADGYEFTNEEFSWPDIEDLEKQDVLEHVFNAESHAEIEVKHSPDNKQELVFKLKSSSEPFALMRIGNNTTWLKEKLSGYEVEEEYDFRSYFENINSDDSTINILLGSRSFYEGWDSNRPNILLFINLGMSKKQKFVMQALGRGLRIEPKENERQRLKFIEDDLPKDKLDCINAVETLLVFGTSVDTLEDIIEAVKYVKTHNFQKVEGIEKNDDMEEDELLIPSYESKEISDVDELSSFPGDREKIEKFVDWLEDERLLFALMERFSVSELKMLKEFLDDGDFHGDTNNPRAELNQLRNHINSDKTTRNGFRTVDDLIIHFRNIEADLDKEEDLEKLEEKIESVNNSEDPDELKQELKQKLENDEIDIEEYTDRIENLKEENPQELSFDKYDLDIQKIKRHFYHPVLYTENGQQSYFRNIIDVDSEVKFIQKLDQAVSNDSVFEEFDWWYFSKISENTDDVYIPYNNNEKFQPDFVFWAKKDEEYHLIFVDPKSDEFTDYQDKVDGYEEVFTRDDRKPREFTHKGSKIKVHLNLFTEQSLDDVSSKYYREFWVNEIDQIVP